MMKMTMAEAQERGIWVSTHDKCVTEVNCGEDYVEFHFAGGFDVVKNGEAESTGAACVRFDGCTADDFDCFIMRKRPSPKGWCIKGRSAALPQLGAMLEKERSSVELYEEMISQGGVYWHGELYKPNRGLGKDVTIKLIGQYSVTYSWE